MNTTDLRMTLEQVRPPAIDPGVHMGFLETKLRDRLAHPRPTTGRRHHRWAWVTILVVIVTGLGFAAAPFVSRITQSVGWSESGGDRFLGSALDQVAPEHRGELADKWERGEGVLVKKVEGNVTHYRVKFTFADGTSTEVWTFAPPDPVQRRELKRLIAMGSGEVAGTVRQDSGMLLYLNRYTLSNGEVVTMMHEFPPMSDGDREATKKAVGSQMIAGGGAVVGEFNGMPVVEYQLPNGQPYTSVSSTPPAKLTPEREQEIHAMQSAGEGRLIKRTLTAEGWAFDVEYKLSDGTVFRIGSDRPPMPDAEWTSVSKDLVVKLGAEEYIEETITGTDGQPVTVLTVELSNGTTFQIPKQMRTLVLDGYKGQ